MTVDPLCRKLVSKRESIVLRFADENSANGFHSLVREVVKRIRFWSGKGMADWNTEIGLPPVPPPVQEDRDDTNICNKKCCKSLLIGIVIIVILVIILIMVIQIK